MKRAFREDEIEPLSIGSWILGTGGGGDPYLGYLNLKKLYRNGKRVDLLPPEDLADDDLVAVVSNMGAPFVGQERLTDPALMVKAVRLMEDHLGRRFDALMPVEIGGGNAFQPFVAAALMDLPVVDADAMGRAFPEAQMTSFAIADLRMYPLTLADIRDNSMIITQAASWKWMERLSRKACTEVGSIAATCKAPRTGLEVKNFGILHTVTKAVSIGKTVLSARRDHRDPIRAILDLEGGKAIFRGKVADVNRVTTEGFLRGHAIAEGLGDHRGTSVTLSFQNEFTAVFLDGQPIVSTPDLICVLDTESGDAVGTETLRYGQRVSIIALKAPPILTTPKGLEHVGPRALGHSFDFTSVFS